MIVANITSWAGYSVGAEHYYCTFGTAVEMPEKILTSNIFTVKDDEKLKRELTNLDEIAYLNKKDDYHFRVGAVVDRWNTIEDIHSELLKRFPNEDIITYYENQAFRDMLLILNGKNYGRSYFKNEWTYCPSSFWSDLIPEEELDSIIVRCDECQREFKLKDVVVVKQREDYNNQGKLRGITIFKTKREMSIKCCNYYQPQWNTIF